LYRAQIQKRLAPGSGFFEDKAEMLAEGLGLFKVIEAEDLGH